MSHLGERTILSIDPGSSKCGVALVRRDPEGVTGVVWQGIVPSGTIGKAAHDLRMKDDFSLVVVGGGTTSRNVVDQLREHMPSVGILVVDEKDTTMNARERYWIDNPRRGWRKLLPATLQTPPEPVDDYVAIILAERVLSST